MKQILMALRLAVPRDAATERVVVDEFSDCAS